MENRTAQIVRIGIDALNLYNVMYGIVNRTLLMDEANKKEKVTYHAEPIEYSPVPKTVEHIVIRDNIMFADLELRKVLVPNRGVKMYGDLELTVHHLCGNNLNNMTVEDYKLRLVEIQEYVAETYGVKLDFYDAAIKTMEINCTFPLRHPFREYDRVIRAFFAKLPGKEKLGKLTERKRLIKASTAGTSDRWETESWSRRNKQTEIIVYNKSREMQDNDNFLVEENLMRLEIRLLTERKVRAVFGTNLFKAITDEMVADFYHDKVCGVYHECFEAWHDVQNVKDLQRLVTEYRGKDKTWHKRVLQMCLDIEIKTHIPVLLDIDDLKDLIPQDKYYNRSRTLKSFDKCAGDASVFFRHDRDKAPEIMDQIETAYQNSISDPDDDG